MVTLRDYPPIEVQAARAVLLELAHLLGEYRQDVVLVGGWVPELLFPEAEITHVGSLDVDLALNHRSLDDAGYRTIHELLVGREYYQKPDGQPFQYFRRVQTAGGQEIIVPVDFLAGEYGGRGRKHRSQRVSGMQPRKARGCDLAFSEPTQIHLEGRLPAGPMDSAILNVVDVTAFIIMKAMAVEGRLNEKDPWDIYFCLCSYPGGTAALAERFKPRLKNGLVREGLQIIADKFASVDHYGPAAVSAFEEITDPEARAIRRRDAFERVRDLLERLGLSQTGSSQ
jgi:hypothetical protein